MVEYHPMKISRKTIIAGFLAAVLLTAIFLVMSKKIGKDLSVSSISGTSSKDLSTKSDNNALSEQNTTQESKQNTLNVPSNLPSAVNVLKLDPVGGKSGQATIVVVKDSDNFVMDIDANLADLPDGQNYTAWIIKKDSSETAKLGNLQKVEGRYVLSANVKGDISGYQMVLFTQETKDDNVPEVKIFEKSL